MREIIVKYAGECRKCGNPLAVGEKAIYERHVGVFCPECAPTDPEEIREYRQEAGERRASKYDEWAEKRITRAQATLKHNETYTGDYAFNTQPGHIPLRARVIAQNDKAFESLRTAERFKEKARSLRNVRVAGDAEKVRQAKREAVLSWLKVGMKVHTAIYGQGVVEKINKKTAKIKETGASGTYTVNIDLSFIRVPIDE